MAAVKTTVTELPDSRVRLDAEVPADEVERRVQEVAKRLGRTLRIPGFRKGKVPPPVVIRRLGRESVLDEAVDSALGIWTNEAIVDSGIAAVGRARIDREELKLPKQGEPLAFSIEIGVRPRAELGKYKGLEVGRREPGVDDRAVDAELQTLRERLSTLETVERAAEQGDQVVIDYLGKLDGEPFAGGEGRDQSLELGSQRFIPGFEEQLVGASAGEQREITVTFPEDYPSEELAGREATFEITVNEVKAKRLPELDDDFAVDAGFDTLAELREDIATRLREAEQAQIEHDFEDAVLDAVVAEAKVEVPHELVHERAHELLEDTLNALAARGISPESYLRITGKDEETLAHEAEPQAERALRREAVLTALIEAERIEPSEEDLKEALQPVAEREGASVEHLLERVRTNGREDQLREDVAARKAVELLVSEAKPIPLEQAKAREQIWTPGKDQPESGQLWTPESSKSPDA
ncbi:MAG TPA: trigger factor [Solirubrobacteraceae bacterium]|nr:trigger factor [Solirubrobacteraceae bacterium]